MRFTRSFLRDTYRSNTKMPQLPHQLIREVQISTRAAAGLPEYHPLDPTLPSLPPLSATIAASGSSAPNLRCKNCKGMLLRGTQSIICLYCGTGPHYDTVPEEICFASSIGYQWLLRSLRLDGLEMIDLNEKREHSVSQNPPKPLTRLSEFLNLKIPWPAETEKQDTNSDKHSKDSTKLLSLSGIPPDAFFLNSKKNALSDMSTDQPSEIQTEITGSKDDADFENQNLFQNVQSSQPAFSSSEQKTGGWADFQSADFETEHGNYISQEHVTGSSADSGMKFPDEPSQSLPDDSGIKLQDFESFQNSSADSVIKFQDPEPFQNISVPEVDLSTHLDSVFGPAANLKNNEPKEGQAVTPAFDDWNTDSTWNNLSSEANFSGGFDDSFITNNNPQDDLTLGHSMGNSTADDLFQDFQFQTDEITNEEHRGTNEDLFYDWNDFAGSTSIQVPSVSALPGNNDQDFSYDEKSSERDLFSFTNKFEGDFDGFPQGNLFSTPTSMNSTLPKVNTIMSEDPTLMSTEEDALRRQSKDDVQTLISQMHDLSFMLETDLSIPSGSYVTNSSMKD